MINRCLFLTLSILYGCAGGFPDVIDARDVPPGLGQPTIRRIRDAGTARVGVLGPWKGESDGVASPGELLLIEGEGFGRQPTVSIGGRATAIIARTRGGGVLVRVPPGVPSGAVPIAVSLPTGRATRTFPIRRLALVVHAGALFVLDVGKDGARPVGKALAIAGARQLRLSGDGGVAYVLASQEGRSRLVVVDVGAAGGPRVVGERALSHPAWSLAGASDTGLVAAMGEGRLTLLVCEDPRAPAPYPSIDLPKEARGARAMELSPDGKVLALLVPEGNKLVALDVAHPPAVKLVTAIDLLPEQRQPLVRDLAFAPDGETLWVVSGDNAQTLPAVQPTRLTAVRLLSEARTPQGEQPRLLSVWRTQSVPGAAAPLHVAVARGQPLAAGTTIRMPPEKAAVFVTSLNDALFKLATINLETREGARAALKLWRPPQPGIMVRADINGGGGPMFATSQILSSVDLTPDAQLLIASSARVASAGSGSLLLEFGVTVARLWASEPAAFVALGPLLPAELKPPFHVGEVRIQP